MLSPTHTQKNRFSALFKKTSGTVRRFLRCCCFRERSFGAHAAEALRSPWFLISGHHRGKALWGNPAFLQSLSKIFLSQVAIFINCLEKTFSSLSKTLKLISLPTGDALQCLLTRTEEDICPKAMPYITVKGYYFDLKWLVILLLNQNLAVCV